MSKQIQKRKGGPIPNKIKDPIIEELTKIVQNGNILGVNQQQLADKFSSQYQINIRRQTIADYLEKVYSSLPPEKIEHTQVKLEVMFNKVFRIVQEMISTAKTNKEKKEAVDLLLRAMDKFTEFLESFGIKQKVADRLDFTADITQKQFSIQIIDDRSKVIQDESSANN